MNAWADQAYMAHMPHGLYNTSPQSQPNSRLGPDAVAFLRAHFKEDPKPSTAFKRQLAAHLHVDIAKINNWFQNERAKAKSMARVEEQRRLNNDDSPEEAKASPSSSNDSPAIEQSTIQSMPRPAPLTLNTLPSTTGHSHFHALDLSLRPQSSQQLHLPVTPHDLVPMSAPAHMTSFPQAQLMSNWADLHHPTMQTTFTIANPSQTLHSATPTLTSDAPNLYFCEIPQPSLSWPADYTAAPLSAGLDAYDNFLNFDTPLHSAQIDGGFSFSSPTDESTYIADSNQFTIAPQLSPSESYHNDSVVSESLPMTPASFGPEPLNTESQFKDSFVLGNLNMSGDISSISPTTAFDTLAPVDLTEHIPSRPSSTQPGASFTRKRNIEIPHLSLNNNSLSLQSSQHKLRMAKSMTTLRAPRSPLHPMRDATRRVTKSPSHARPPMPPMPSMPNMSSIPAMPKLTHTPC